MTMAQENFICFYRTKTLHLTMDTSETLMDLRKRLVREGLIGSEDTHEDAPRFLDPQVTEEEYFYNEGTEAKEGVFGIIYIGQEKRYNISECLTDGKLTVVNIAAKKRPDLIGFLTDKWRDKDIWVTCHDRKSMVSSLPIMLKHTRPSNSSLAGGYYDNVCICAPDTELGITIHAKGGVGFAFSIKDDMGVNIVTRLFRTYTAKEGEGSVYVSRWQNEDNAIVVKDAKKLNITPDLSCLYQRVTIQCRKVISYSIEGGGKVRNRSVVGVPGERLEDGKLEKGAPTGHGFGTIYDVEVDENAVLGEVTITFFVFSSKEEAQKFVELRTVGVKR